MLGLRTNNNYLCPIRILTFPIETLSGRPCPMRHSDTDPSTGLRLIVPTNPVRSPPLHAALAAISSFHACTLMSPFKLAWMQATSQAEGNVAERCQALPRPMPTLYSMPPARVSVFRRRPTVGGPLSTTCKAAGQ